MAAPLHIGFIGLGDQGGPMAQMILTAGFDLTIWARRGAVRRQYEALGAIVADSPQALAENCDLLCLCVTGDQDVRSLLLDQHMLAALPKGAIIAQHSTIDPETCVEMAALANKRGVTFLDVPVSGSGRAALAKNLLILCGGDKRSIDDLRPIMESYAGEILHMGGVGDAMRTKLLNNLMAAVNIGQAVNLLNIADGSGMNITKFRQAILAGTGRSYGMESIIRLQHPERAAHVFAILRKDVKLAMSLLSEKDAAIWGELADTGLAALEKLATDANLSRWIEV